MRCPHCQQPIDVRFVKAPPIQADTVKPPTNGSTGDLATLLGRIEDGALTGQAVEFVSQTRERFEKYGATTRVSEKQLAWLRKIADEQESGEAF